jgi:amino acid adenylation domain-containing protein
LAHLPSQSAFHNFLRFTWENSTFYRNLYGAHGIRAADLDQISLQDLPIVTKEMIYENYDEVVTDARIRLATVDEWLVHDHDARSHFLGEFLVIHSTGTSRSRIAVLYDQTDWRRMTAMAAGYLYPPGSLSATAGYRNAFYISHGDHTASATTALNSSSGIFERQIIRIEDPPEASIARLNAFQPDRLTSYSSSLGWLAELSLKGLLKIAPRDVLATSDRMTPAIEAQIRQAWNSNIYNLYAASESLYMAIKKEGRTEWKVLEELQTIEVLDGNGQQVKSGEVGRAVLTNWNNRTLPLIRYDMSDYVICGETQPGNCSLGGFAGRAFDNLPIRLANGHTGEIPCHALTGFSASGLDTLQFISISPEKVEVQYCAGEDMDEVLRPRIVELLHSWGGERTSFTLKRVEHIWNDIYSYKYLMVRQPDDQQVGLPATILNSNQMQEPAEKLRPGGGFKPFAREFLQDSIAAVFERQATRWPEVTAVKDGQELLTYDQLNRAANRVAHTLMALQMAPSHPVALLFNHRAAMITAMLGVLKSGGWYAPLDPSHPAARNTAILKESGAELVLTDFESLDAARANGFKEAQIINLDGLDASVDYSNPGLQISPGTPACLLYTSGSTGQPKGVVLDQRAILHRVMLYTNDYAIGPEDRPALLQSYVFNASVREIYGALLNGAGLQLYSLKRDGVHRLKAWLQHDGISMMYMVPGVFRVFLDTLQGDRFEHLRLIRLGGEAVLARDVAGFHRHFGPECLLANGLASTETGTICQSFFSLHSHITGKHVPAGIAVHDKDVSLLGEDGSPVEDGMIGEIVVTSSYLGPGYFQPAESIMNSPFPVERCIHTGDLGFRLPEGSIVLAGRKDRQIKLRGQRMNLLEIEQALLSLDNVAEAAVILQNGEEDAAFLAAHIQPEAAPAPSADVLRLALRKQLPEVMIPVVFTFFDELPRMVSGKVDRLSRPAVKRGPEAYYSPKPQTGTDSLETPTQVALAKIWTEVLGVEPSKITDDFFELGGQSLLAMQLLARIYQEFGQSLPPAILLEHNTIGKLAELISGNAAIRRKSLVAIRSHGTKKPIFLLPGSDGDVLYFRNLINYVDADRPLYGLQIKPEEPGRSYAMEVMEIACEYLSEILQLQPEGPYYLAGHSFGGYIAMEMAHQLLKQGRKVAFLGLWDTFPPGPNRQAAFLDRVKIHLINLRGLNPHLVFGYFKDRWIALLIRAYRVAALRSLMKRTKVFPKDPYIAARFSSYGFNPDPYPGDIFLFKVVERPWYIHWDPLEPWQKYVSGKLDIREVPGKHGTMLFEPYVQNLAAQLNDCLRQVEKRYDHPSN